MSEIQTPATNETTQVDSTQLSNPELAEFTAEEKTEPTEPSSVPKDSTKVEQPETIERPEWLPENFKTPEDLAKSYREQQAEFTRRSQELAETKKMAEALKIEKINTIAADAEVVLMNDLKKLDLALQQGQFTQSEYEFTKQQAVKAYEQYVEQLKSYKPQIQQEQQQDLTQFIEKYGEPINIDDFATQNKDFLNQPYKQDIFNGLKTLYGGQLGSKELEALRGMIEAVEKGTEARIRAELNTQNQQLDIKSRMTSAVNNMPQSSGGEVTWTRAEIDKLSPQDFLKYEKEIEAQLIKGLIK